MATRVSRINPNIPQKGKAYTKEVQTNFQYAWEEITELLNRNQTPGVINDVPPNPPGEDWTREYGQWVPLRVDGGTF